MAVSSSVTATKRCSRCGRDLPFSEFNKNKNKKDGLQDKCRECCSKYNRERYLKNPDKFKENTRKNHAEHPDRELESRLRTYKKKPGKIEARRIVEVAIRAGMLEKPDYCQGCGCHKSEHRIEAHHSDYSKPLSVIWLCPPCHWQMDQMRRKREG